MCFGGFAHVHTFRNEGGGCLSPPPNPAEKLYLLGNDNNVGEGVII